MSSLLPPSREEAYEGLARTRAFTMSEFFSLSRLALWSITGSLTGLSTSLSEVRWGRGREEGGRGRDRGERMRKEGGKGGKRRQWKGVIEARREREREKRRVGGGKEVNYMYMCMYG